MYIHIYTYVYILNISLSYIYVYICLYSFCSGINFECIYKDGSLRIIITDIWHCMLHLHTYATLYSMLGCVNSLKVKIFRYVALKRHIKSVRFTTKIRKIRNIRPCFSNSGDNTVVSQLCNFSCKTTLLPPKQFPVEHISMHTYSVGWHVSCYHPPMHAY